MTRVLLPAVLRPCSLEPLRQASTRRLDTESHPCPPGASSSVAGPARTSPPPPSCQQGRLKDTNIATTNDRVSAAGHPLLANAHHDGASPRSLRHRRSSDNRQWRRWTEGARLALLARQRHLPLEGDDFLNEHVELHMYRQPMIRAADVEAIWPVAVLRNHAPCYHARR